MRNLKKVLALVLALVMAMSLVTIANAASFSDADDINYTEAVDVLTALKVIDGVGNNTFNPTGTVTRAQMAKMITIVALGNVEPSAFLGTKTDLTDIDGHWAEAYIKYCYSQGIIAGKGNGKFDPNANVTNAEASKMLLTAIGYNSSVQGYTGAQWAINVTRDAQTSKFYKDLSVPAAQALTRDQAAQLIYNAIQADMIQKSSNVNREDGSIVDIYEPVSGKTLLKETFGGAIKLAYLESFTYDTAKGQWTYNFQGDQTRFGGNSIDANDQIESSGDASTKNLKSTVDYTDMFGKQVRVVYKTDVNNVIYGVFANDSKVLATGATGQIGDIDTVANTAVINGTTVKFDDVDAAQLVYDWNSSSARAIGGVDTVAELKADTTAFTFEVVDNDGDSKADAVLVTPMAIGKISYVGSDSVTFGAPIAGTSKVADITIYDGYAKDDWVARIASTNATTGIVTYEKMDVQTGTISGVKTVDGVEQYLIDGVWYTKGTDASGAQTNLVTLGVNDTIDFVAVGSRLFYTKISESGLTGKDVVMVVTVGETNAVSGISNASAQAKLLFSNGDTEVVGLAKVDGVTANYTSGDQTGVANKSVGHLYTYRINSDGDYELTKLSTTNLAGYDGVGTSANYNDKTIGGYELADDAIVFALTSGAQETANATNKGKVYSGREIKNNYTTASFGAAQSAGYVSCVYGKVNGFDYARVAVLVGNVTINTGSNYGYLVTDAYEGREGADTYRYFNIWTANGQLTVKEKNSNGLDGLKAGVVVTYDVTDTEGVVKNVSVPAVTTSAITGWDETSGKIQFNTGLSNKVTSDTVVIYVDSSKQTGSEGGSISIANSPSTGVYNDNVRYICAPSAAYVDLLLVDINNDMEDAPEMLVAGSITAGDIATAFTNSDTVILDGATFTGSTGSISVGATQTLIVKNSTVNLTSGQTLTINGAGTVDMKGVVTLTEGALTFAPTGTVNWTEGAGFSVAAGKTLTMGSTNVSTVLGNVAYSVTRNANEGTTYAPVAGVSGTPVTLNLGGDLTIGKNDKLEIPAYVTVNIGAHTLKSNGVIDIDATGVLALNNASSDLRLNINSVLKVAASACITNSASGEVYAEAASADPVGAAAKIELASSSVDISSVTGFGSVDGSTALNWYCSAANSANSATWAQVTP